MMKKKGKPLTRGAKTIIQENSETFKFYRNMVIGAWSIYALVKIFFGTFPSTTEWINIILAFSMYLFAFVSMSMFFKLQDEKTGEIFDTGLDLNMEGGVGEHLKDMIIATSISVVLASISTYFWLLLIMIPLRAIYLIWDLLLRNYFFPPVGANENPQDNMSEKKKKKLERQRVKYSSR